MGIRPCTCEGDLRLNEGKVSKARVGHDDDGNGIFYFDDDDYV